MSKPAPRTTRRRATTATAATEVWPRKGNALRFRVPDDGSTTVPDVIRGNPVFEHSTIEDFVIVRSDGSPLFLLANVVDDVDMAITHVIRGEEHLPNTPKYLLLWDALDGERTAGVRPPPGDREREAPEAVEASPRGQGQSRGLPNRRLPARGHAQLPGSLGLGSGRRARGPQPRRDDRRVLARSGQQLDGLLRPAEAPALQRRVHPGPARRGVHRADRPWPWPWRPRS